MIEEWEAELKEIERLNTLKSYDIEAKRNAILKLQEQQQNIRIQITEVNLAIIENKNKAREIENKIRVEHLRAEESKKAEEINLQMDELATLIAGHVKDLLAVGKLHDYQHQDILMTIRAYTEGLGGMLNANDMGMGKTAEAAICIHILSRIYFETHGKIPNVLWLTKKSLVIKKSTEKEILKWTPYVHIIASDLASNPKAREMNVEFYKLVPDYKIFLANYEFIRTTAKSIGSVDWNFVVIDEVHKLKGGANSSGPTAIFTAAKDLVNKADFKLFLSGTPMVNKSEEMWAYLHIFDDERFPSLSQFRKDFKAYQTLATTAKIEIDPNKIMNQALRGRMIRRSAEEVGLELPELTEDYLDVGMTDAQQDAYDQMKFRFFIWLEEQEKAVGSQAILAQLTRLRQINVWPHVFFKQKQRDEYGVIVLDDEGRPIIEVTELPIFESAKIDETMDKIEGLAGKQIIIGSTFNEPLFEIQRRCKEQDVTCGVIYGDADKDIDFEGDFQQGKIQVLCINLKMGEGLNLQKNPTEWPGGASYAILLDKWYTPAVNLQFIKRIWRQGSKIPCTVWYMHNEGTIDDFVQLCNDEKEESFGSIMNSKEIRPKEDWIKLLRGKL